MTESIIRTFQHYVADDYDLAISLTARTLRIDEFEVRNVLDT